MPATPKVKIKDSHDIDGLVKLIFPDFENLNLESDIDYIATRAKAILRSSYPRALGDYEKQLQKTWRDYRVNPIKESLGPKWSYNWFASTYGDFTLTATGDRFRFRFVWEQWYRGHDEPFTKRDILPKVYLERKKSHLLKEKDTWANAFSNTYLQNELKITDCDTAAEFSRVFLFRVMFDTRHTIEVIEGSFDSLDRETTRVREERKKNMTCEAHGGEVILIQEVKRGNDTIRVCEACLVRYITDNKKRFDGLRTWAVRQPKDEEND